MPKEHPLRRIKQLADAALAELSPLFDEMYSAVGTAVDPARAAAEGLAADGAVHGAQRAACSASSSTTTCCSAGSWTWTWTSRASTTRPSRATARGCWSTTWRASSSARWSRRRARCKLLSDEHFTVDGTLIEAWASLKSFKRKDAGTERAARRSGQPDGELPRRAPLQRDASIDDRSRGEAGARRARAKRRSCVTRPTR